jgi:hypothetical protein
MIFSLTPITALTAHALKRVAKRKKLDKEEFFKRGKWYVTYFI